MAIAGAGTAEVKPELVDYLGYTDCIDLKDAVCRVVLGQQAGGR